MIKKLILLTFILIQSVTEGKIQLNSEIANKLDNLQKNNCTYKGVKLYGKIKFVTSFPDIKIQIVKSFPDLKVKIVDAFPNQCGEWKIVESFPDLKVQVVESFPDLKVQFVENFPGMN